MKRVIFHPEAEVEFLAAAEFYEAHRRGLGVEFIAEVRHAAGTLQRHPELGHPFSRRLRRLLVQRFPYGLLYRIEAEDIFIVAVAHLSRRPGYWHRRR